MAIRDHSDVIPIRTVPDQIGNENGLRLRPDRALDLLNINLVRVVRYVH